MVSRRFQAPCASLPPGGKAAPVRSSKNCPIDERRLPDSLIARIFSPMALRYRRRIRLARGLSLNLSRSGASISVGTRGAHVTVSPRGRRATVGLPGSGLSYATYQPHPIAPHQRAAGIGIAGHFVIGILIALAGFVLLALIGAGMGG
jgi:Protein of unknown function (DUF4236)